MIIDRVQIADALPGYELGEMLGRGSFGLVLAARHRELGRHVAVKIVSAGHTGFTVAGEAQLLARMDHPHIVRVYDYLKADDLRLIIMELLDGDTLTVRQQGGMTPEEACAVGLAIAAALSCAHAQTPKVLHRDIKPDNVLFDAAGLLKVTDFGIAKIVEGSATTASGLGRGTPAYMAPEQIEGGKLRPATDLYALGVVLYQLLAGKLPFDPSGGVQALWRQHLNTTPDPPAGAPDPVADVVLRALAKDAAHRQPSAQAFALDLAEAATTAFGPGWTAHTGLVLRLDDDIRAAVGNHVPTSAAPTMSAVSAAPVMSAAPTMPAAPTPVTPGGAERHPPELPSPEVVPNRADQLEADVAEPALEKPLPKQATVPLKSNESDGEVHAVNFREKSRNLVGGFFTATSVLLMTLGILSFPSLILLLTLGMESLLFGYLGILLLLQTPLIVSSTGISVQTDLTRRRTQLSWSELSTVEIRSLPRSVGEGRRRARGESPYLIGTPVHGYTGPLTRNRQTEHGYIILNVKELRGSPKSVVDALVRYSGGRYRSDGPAILRQESNDADDGPPEPYESGDSRDQSAAR